jgi:anti-sigma regulatory factor (Ser/Thr protein kinase)
VETVLRAVPESVVAARRALDQFDSIPEPVRSLARVVLSEIVTNEIRHGRQPDGQIVCVFKRLPNALRIEVWHRGPAFDAAKGPVTAPKDPLQESGLGLWIVENLASRWVSMRRGTRTRFGLSSIFPLSLSHHDVRSAPGGIRTPDLLIRS